MIFGGTRDWHLGSHFADAARRAGVDLASMDKAISDPTSHRQEVEENQAALAAAPQMVVMGADDDVFAFELRVIAFDDADDVISRDRAARDLNRKTDRHVAKLLRVFR